ncbi:MAG TPA: hypothetical protein VJ623_07975 [Holophagaceae bacterium]|nr:hypothetical protein [Holophagaceae bacterium]
MRAHSFHPFSHLHEPQRMDLMAWLALLMGALLALAFYHPGVHS